MSIPFSEWIQGARFYLNWDRYANFCRWGFVAASSYGDDPKLEEAIEELDAGDPEMITAMEWLRDNRDKYWTGYGETPSEAFKMLENKMMAYHAELSERQDQERNQ